MSEKRITMKARIKCAEWLTYCLEIGWTKDQLDGLEEMWWKFRDHNGNLKPSSASPDTPAPLTYTPAQVIEMLRGISKESNIPLDRLMTGVVCGDLYVWDYDPGRSQRGQFKTISINGIKI